jgi:CheY-like chemotaxis protein
MEPLARESLRIVHVDDDDDFVELSARALRRVGFKKPIERCVDGRSALRYFASVKPHSAPHIILVDFHMPDMDGLAVLHWLRENYGQRDVAVYLLTSSENPEHRRRAMDYGVTEYLLKSPSSDTLVQKLDQLIAVTNGQVKKKRSKDTKMSVRKRRP